MTQQGSGGASAIATIAIGVSVATLLYLAGQTALGNPHRTLGIVLLMLQLPGGIIAHAVVGGSGFRMQPGEAPTMVAVNAMVYSITAYGILRSIARLRASRTRRPAPAT